MVDPRTSTLLTVGVWIFNHTETRIGNTDSSVLVAQEVHKIK